MKSHSSVGTDNKSASERHRVWKKNKLFNYKNWRKKTYEKNATAQLVELELTDDLSQKTDEPRETLPHIRKHAKQTTSQRVSDWVNEFYEPDSILNQPQTSTVGFDNVAESFNTPVIPESNNVIRMRQATVP